MDSYKGYIFLDYDGTLVKAVSTEEGGYNAEIFFKAAEEIVEAYSVSERILTREIFGFMCDLSTGSTELSLSRMLKIYCGICNEERIQNGNDFARIFLDKVFTVKDQEIRNLAEDFAIKRKYLIEKQRREIGAFKEDEILNGVNNFLELASKEGYCLVLVTGNPENVMESRCNLELRKYFEGEESTLRCIGGLAGFTRQELIEVAIKKFNPNGKLMVYIGDADLDREAGFEPRIATLIGMNPKVLPERDYKEYERIQTNKVKNTGKLLCPVIRVGADKHEFDFKNYNVVFDVQDLSSVTIEDIDLLNEVFKEKKSKLEAEQKSYKDEFTMS